MYERAMDTDPPEHVFMLLPAEDIRHILQYLDYNSIAAFMLACRYCYTTATANSNMLNKKYIEQHLHGTSEPEIRDIMKRASIAGNIDAIRALANNERIYHMGNVILIDACRYGHYDIFEYLSRFPNIDYYTRRHALLYDAIKNGCMKIVLAYVQKLGVNLADSGYISAACICKDGAMFDLISQYDVDFAENNNRPIRYAAMHGNSYAVKKLLSRPEIDPSDMQNDALYDAVRYNRIDIVCMLLDDPRTDKNTRVIHMLYSCVISKYIEMAELLLSRCDIDLYADGYACVTKAICLDNDKLVHALWNKCDSRVNESADVLYHAIRHNYIHIVKASNLIVTDDLTSLSCLKKAIRRNYADVTQWCMETCESRMSYEDIEGLCSHAEKSEVLDVLVQFPRCAILIYTQKSIYRYNCKIAFPEDLLSKYEDIKHGNLIDMIDKYPDMLYEILYIHLYTFVRRSSSKDIDMVSSIYKTQRYGKTIEITCMERGRYSAMKLTYEQIHSILKFSRSFKDEEQYEPIIKLLNWLFDIKEGMILLDDHFIIKYYNQLTILHSYVKRMNLKPKHTLQLISRYSSIIDDCAQIINDINWNIHIA